MYSLSKKIRGSQNYKIEHSPDGCFCLNDNIEMKQTMRPRLCLQPKYTAPSSCVGKSNKKAVLASSNAYCCSWVGRDDHNEIKKWAHAYNMHSWILRRYGRCSDRITHPVLVQKKNAWFSFLIQLIHPDLALIFQQSSGFTIVSYQIGAIRMWTRS